MKNPESNLTKELELAVQAAKMAGQIIASYYGSPLRISHKSLEQPVTQADLEANHIIREILTSSFPNYGWLSEEDMDNTDRLSQKTLWIVDPLDGTKDFIEKNPEFAVSIGLVTDGKPILGVVYNPITREMFTATKFHHATLNKKKIHIKPMSPSRKIELMVSRSEYKRGEWDPYKEEFLISSTGGCAYKMVKIAEGQADGTFTLTPKSEWDTCAGHIILERAGGLVTDLKGHEICYNKKIPSFEGMIYCNSQTTKDVILSAIRDKTSN